MNSKTFTPKAGLIFYDADGNIFDPNAMLEENERLHKRIAELEEAQSTPVVGQKRLLAPGAYSWSPWQNTSVREAQLEPRVDSLGNHVEYRLLCAMPRKGKKA